MCGRYTLFTPQPELEERFDARAGGSLDPRYNCAPTQELPVVTNESPDEFRSLRWGLIPSWADDDDTSFINARSETAREKRSFREPFERRRCLVPADGFYEWVERDGGKQPYRVAFADDRPFALAGLWERWRPPQVQTGLDAFGGGERDTADADDHPVVESFTILTTEPNDLVADLHDRMAVILDPDDESTWLHGDPDDAAAVLGPCPDDELVAYPVSTRVNSPANDDSSLVEPVDG
jgi:putative SOS response-associated peptidase YedK